jgi:hypothetical protein
MNLLTIVFVLLVAALVVTMAIYLGKLRKWRLMAGGSDRKRGKLRVKDLKKHPRSKSEAQVVSYLESITGQRFPTIYPDWLTWKGHVLELDGYNERLNVALEFSGPLHTKWFPTTETYPEYFERVVRDVVKRRLCKRYGVNLIVVDVSLPSQHWRTYVMSRLYDFNVLSDRPYDYIAEQVAAPFRNEQLEKEFGLAVDMEMAEKI